MKKFILGLSISLVFGSQHALANPNGPQVVHGSATFSNPSADVLNVTNSHNAVINWQSFNIGRGQTTNFFQPSAGSSVLNRVITNNPSQLLGNLNSNGKVFLINQNGILVGADARINTGGFFASTLNITDEDFLNGRLKFEGGGVGGIDNQGYIHATDDGNIVLIAPNIENGGVISTEEGNVVLAAGESITISSLENPAMQFAVTAEENSVTNLGSIIANRGAATMFAGTLRHSGSIRAGGVVRNADGSISLVAEQDITLEDNSSLQAAEVTVQSEQGTTMVEGDISASDEQGMGGKIQLLGENVGITGDAHIDASGENGGGEILIGGDVQGSNPEVPNAAAVWIGQDSEISADATENGDGGKVIVYADQATRAYGRITATGGPLGGDGGFIETSGGFLDLGQWAPDASATNGANGEWLIDPNNITISTGPLTAIIGVNDFTSSTDGAVLDVTTIVTALNAGNNVTVTTGTAAPNLEPGDIFLNASIDAAPLVDVSLTLNAHNDIVLDNSANIVSTGTGVLNLVFNPDLDGNLTGIVNLGSAPGGYTIDTNGGTLTITGDASFSAQGNLNLSNTTWINTNTLSFGNSGSASLNLDLASSLINQGIVDFSGISINGQGSLINESELNFTNTFSSLSSIGPNIGLTNLGQIDVASGHSVDLSGSTLTLGVGAGLSGGGSWIGDVNLDGGYLYPGDLGNYFTGTDILNIGGNLTINSGALITVIGDWNGRTSGTQVNTGGNLQINGGDLLTIWDGNANINDDQVITSGDVINPASCLVTGCYNQGAFDRVVNAVGLLSSTPDYASSDLGMSLELTAIDNVTGNFVFWTGPSGDWSTASNWSGGVVPVATDYAIILNPDGETFATVSDAQAVAGLQSFANLNIGAGGNLDINGDGFIIDDFNPLDGVLSMSTTDARLSGGGVLYTLPGTTTDLALGTLTKDMVNWGEVRTTAGNIFQLNSNLANFSVISLDDTQGPNSINTITGPGSISNFGILDFGDAALLALDGQIVLTSASGNSRYVQFPIGANNGLIQLNGSSRFDLALTPGFYDQSIGWELNGGDVILGAGTSLSLNAPIKFEGAGGNLFIDNLGLLSSSGDMTINHSTGTAGISGLGSFNNNGNILQTSLNDFSVAVASFSSLGNIGINNGNFLLQSPASFDIGDLAIAAGATFTVDNGGSLFTGSTFNGISGGGSLIVNGGGLLDFDVWFGKDLSSLSAFDVNGGTVRNVQDTILPNSFNLSGTALVQGDGTLVIPSTTTVNVNGGTFSGINALQLLTIDQQGTIDILAGQTLNLLFADLQVAPTASLTGAGTLLLPLDGKLTGSNASVDVTNLVLNQGEIVANNLTYTGNFDWQSGIISGTGPFVTTGQTRVQGGADLQTDWTISTTGSANIQGDVTFSNGSIAIASGTSLAIDTAAGLTLGPLFGAIGGGGTLLVDAGGLFDLGTGAIDLSGLGAFNVNDGLVTNVQDTLLPATVNLVGINGIIKGDGNLVIPVGSILSVGGGLLSGDLANLSINNLGTIDVLDTQTLSLNNADLTIAPTGFLSGAGQIALPLSGQLIADGTVDIAQVLLTGGTLTANNLDYAGNLVWADGSVNGTGLTTSGQVILTTGQLDTSWLIAPTGTVSWIGSSPVNQLPIISGGITNQGVLVFNAQSDTDVFQLDFTNDAGTIGIQSGILQKVDATGVAQDLFLDQAGDSLQGFGTFDGSVFNGAGIVSPGRTDPLADIFQTGTLTITGDYNQGTNGRLFMKLDSTVQNTTPVLLNDTLQVGGTLNAGGDLVFQVVNNSSPVELALLLDQSFRPFVFNSFAGRFDSVTIPTGLNFTLGDDGLITITSDNLVLNTIANQLELLFESDDLDYLEIVTAMRFIDRRLELFDPNGEEDDVRRRAPRLVCR